MTSIGVIGAGFSGIMTITHLIQSLENPTEIILFDDIRFINKGIAYSTHSHQHLLNVVAQKMSAFPNDNDHFLNWILSLEKFKNQKRSLIANSFLPRKLYGDYLSEIWRKTLDLITERKHNLTIVNSKVAELKASDNQKYVIKTENNLHYNVDYCIIATGNQLPRNPFIKNNEFFKSENYFQNPWSINSVSQLDNSKPILIIGNGLTMVDCVLSLIEKGFNNTIYTLSPNGYHILPHRSNGIIYTDLMDELKEKNTLLDIVTLVNKHRKLVRSLGQSAEIVIDSLRPYTHELWRNFSENDKFLFMQKFRHLWGVARHRISINIHDKIQQLRLNKELIVFSGKLLEIEESANSIKVSYRSKENKDIQTIYVGRIINCTGPETVLENLNDSFLKNCFLNGLLTQDSLKLGIKTDLETFETINSKNQLNENVFTLGPNLKGELWESIAIPELKIQAKKLSDIINFKIEARTNLLKVKNGI